MKPFKEPSKKQLEEVAATVDDSLLQNLLLDCYLAAEKYGSGALLHRIINYGKAFQSALNLKKNGGIKANTLGELKEENPKSYHDILEKIYHMRHDFKIEGI